MYDLVALDFSVLAHLLSQKIGANALPNPTQDQLDNWALELTSLLPLGYLVNPDSTLVLLLDQKDSHLGYWRHAAINDPLCFLSFTDKKREKARKQVRDLLDKGLTAEAVMLIQDNRIGYKAGRKFPPKGFNTFKLNLLSSFRKAGCPIFSLKGFEADDLAAGLSLHNPDRKILYLTVDSDWMGLIEPGRTGWLCMAGYSPRHRYNLETVNEWAVKRLGTVLSKPSDIWAVKAEQGDKSDNLPKGTPVSLISLLEPLAGYEAWKQLNLTIKPCLGLAQRALGLWDARACPFPVIKYV